MTDRRTSDPSAADIDLDEAPPLTDADWQRAAHRVGLKPATTPKVEITIPLDGDVLAWLQEHANSEDYPALINGALRDTMREHHLEETLRRVIRDELRAR